MLGCDGLCTSLTISFARIGMVLAESTIPKRLKKIQSFRDILAEELGVDKIFMHKVCVFSCSVC